MSRAAARFNRSFQTSTPDRDARLRLAGENSLDRGAPGTNSSAPLSVHAPMFHQHHVVKTFAKDHIPDPAGILDVTSPKPASRPPKRDRLPVPSLGSKQVLPKHPHLPTPKSNQWIESPNTVTALSLHSTPVAKPPRQFHKPKSPSPVIQFGDFSVKQTPPTPITVPKEIPKTTPVTTLNGISKSTPRFSLPPRRNRPTKSPVAKTDQVTQTTPMPPSIARIKTVPELAHQALQLAKHHGPLVLLAASIRQQAAQSISRAFRLWYSRQPVSRRRSASVIAQQKQHLYAAYVQSKIDLISKKHYRIIGALLPDSPLLKTPDPFADYDFRQAHDTEIRRLQLTVDEAKEIWHRDTWAKNEKNGVVFGQIYTTSEFFNGPQEVSGTPTFNTNQPTDCGYFTLRNWKMKEENNEHLHNRTKRRQMKQHTQRQPFIQQQRREYLAKQKQERQQPTVSLSPVVRRSPLLQSQPQDHRLQSPISLSEWQRSRTDDGMPPPPMHLVSIVDQPGLTFTHHTAVVHSALKEAYMGLDPNIELFATTESLTIPAAAAPWSHRSSNLASTHNDNDDEHGYRQHSSPSASAPTRDSHEEETRFVPDPFVVNIQRTLVTDDTGARYPISYQESAVRMSYAHAFEQPSPYPATPLVNALSNSDDDNHNHNEHFDDNGSDTQLNDKDELHYINEEPHFADYGDY